MKRILTAICLVWLLCFACNKKNEQDVIPHYASIGSPIKSGKNYEALQDTLDSLNTVLFQKIKAGDRALRHVMPDRAPDVVARTSLWPIHPQ